MCTDATSLDYAKRDNAEQCPSESNTTMISVQTAHAGAPLSTPLELTSPRLKLACGGVGTISR